MLNATYKNNPIIDFLVDGRWRYIRHFLLILLLASIFGLLSPTHLQKVAVEIKIPFSVLYIGTCIDMLISLVLVYFNLYFLFPRFFKKGLYSSYAYGVIVSSILLFFSTYFIQQYYVYSYGKETKFAVQLTLEDFLGISVFPIVFLCATTGYKVFRDWISDQERFAALEKEKLRTELSQLKNQVNPHFLFNTLNNLHVLIQTNPTKASDMVLGLSDVLRY